MASKRLAPYVVVDTNSGAPGWYNLVDPAISKSKPHFPAYSGATMPKGMFVQRGWSKKTTAEVVITVAEEGALVLRADVAAKVVEGTGLKTQPIVVRMTNGAAVEGWVLVVVDCWAPLDRSQARATWVGSKDGRLGIAAKLEAIDWSAARTPRAPIFRLVEAPNVLVARADFMTKLVKATKVGVRPGELERPAMFVPTWCAVGPFKVKPKDAEAAEDAYWQLAGGAPDTKARTNARAKARASACKHPLYALALALEVDRAPEADTRKAACAHPVTALQYATLVDTRAHPATRAAADRDAWCAYRHAYALDRAISDALAKRAIAAEFEDAAGIAAVRQELAAL
jgi:hypothetical protein